MMSPLLSVKSSVQFLIKTIAASFFSHREIEKYIFSMEEASLNTYRYKYYVDALFIEHIELYRAHY